MGVGIEEPTHVSSADLSRGHLDGGTYILGASERRAGRDQGCSILRQPRTHTHPAAPSLPLHSKLQKWFPEF